MGKEVLEIIKQKEDWRVSIEIAENSKQEPSISVKVRGDGPASEAGKEALEEYNALKEKMSK